MTRRLTLVDAPKDYPERYVRPMPTRHLEAVVDRDFDELSRQIELVSTELTDRFEKFGAVFPATREPSHVSLSRPFGECPGRRYSAADEEGVSEYLDELRASARVWVRRFCIGIAVLAILYFAGQEFLR